MLKRKFTFQFIVSVVLIIGSVAVSMADVRFASGRSALKIPFKLYNNHIYLRVGVNKSQPLWFLLDTAAGNIINRRQAEKLGLKLVPVGQTNGVGENSVDVSIAENVSFTLPGAVYKEQKIAVVSLENVEQCGDKITVDAEGKISVRQKPATGDERQPIDGVLGDDFFKNVVVEIDYASRFVNLYEPKSYRYSGGGKAIPLELTDNHIYIRAPLTAASKQTPVGGRLMIDSGSMVALVLNRPFVETNKLLPPPEQTVPFDVCGIGGDSKTRLGTLENLRLENFDIKNPPAMFSQAANGVLARTDFDGTVGNAILRRFHVVFDYSRRQMILEPASKN